MTRILQRAAAARLLSAFLAAYVLYAVSSTLAQELEPHEREVSLSELLLFAEKHAPTTQVAAKRTGYAQAARAGAEPRVRSNPTLEVGIGPRFNGASDHDFDFIASLGQPVEVSGQRRLRLEAAARLSEQLDGQLEAVRWEVRREITVAYQSATVARERVHITERLLSFADELLATAQRRFSVGDANVIDVRVAEIDQAEARQAKLAAAQELRSARIRLAEVSGWPIEAPPNVVPGLASTRAVPSLKEVMEAAADRHPELRARLAATAQAHAQMQVADREAWATPVVGLQVAREGSAGSPANYIVLGTLGTTLPFAQRNQGERVRARVDEEVARAEEGVATRALHGLIARAHAELSAASERLAIFTSSLTPKLEDNLTLLRRGFDAGELPLLTVSTARARFLQAQYDALAAYADYYRALAELEFAMGVQLPTSGGLP